MTKCLNIISDRKPFFCKVFPNLNVLTTWCITSEKISGKNDFSYHFKKIIARYKKIGYNIDVLRQAAWLVVDPMKVNK